MCSNRYAHHDLYGNLEQYIYGMMGCAHSSMSASEEALLPSQTDIVWWLAPVNHAPVANPSYDNIRLQTCLQAMTALRYVIPLVGQALVVKVPRTWGLSHDSLSFRLHGSESNR